MGSNFHTFYPRQRQQGLVFCTPNAKQCEIVSKGSVFLQFCDEIQSSMHRILTQMYSAVSIGTSNMESPTEFSHIPPPLSPSNRGGYYGIQKKCPMDNR